MIPHNCSPSWSEWGVTVHCGHVLRVTLHGMLLLAAIAASIVTSVMNSKATHGSGSVALCALNEVISNVIFCHAP